MRRLTRVLLILASPACWFAMLASLSLAMMHWRVTHEPGYPDEDALWMSVLSVVLLAGGALGTLAINLAFVLLRERWFWIAWLLNLGATGLYAPIFGLTVLMMA